MLTLADFAVVVKDARSTAEWWHDKVGFETHTVGGGTGHAVMVAPPGEPFLLHLCEGFEPVDPGNTGVAFVTDSIVPLVRRMEAGGVQFPQPLRKESWGSMAKFADPDGNVFWLLEAPSAFIRKEKARRAPRSPRARRGKSSAGGRSGPRRE